MALNTHLSNILVAPWKYYWRVAAFTFGAVTVTNFGTCIYDDYHRNILLEQPAIVTGFIVGKGLLLAPIWPTWFINIAIRPKAAFCLGGGVIAERIRASLSDIRFEPTITYGTMTTSSSRSDKP